MSPPATGQRFRLQVSDLLGAVMHSGAHADVTPPTVPSPSPCINEESDFIAVPSSLTSINSFPCARSLGLSPPFPCLRSPLLRRARAGLHRSSPLRSLKLHCIRHHAMCQPFALLWSLWTRPRTRASGGGGLGARVEGRGHGQHQPGPGELERVGRFAEGGMKGDTASSSTERTLERQRRAELSVLLAPSVLPERMRSPNYPYNTHDYIIQRAALPTASRTYSPHESPCTPNRNTSTHTACTRTSHDTHTRCRVAMADVERGVLKP